MRGIGYPHPVQHFHHFRFQYHRFLQSVYPIFPTIDDKHNTSSSIDLDFWFRCHRSTIAQQRRLCQHNKIIHCVDTVLKRIGVKGHLKFLEILEHLPDADLVIYSDTINLIWFCGKNGFTASVQPCTDAIQIGTLHHGTFHHFVVIFIGSLIHMKNPIPSGYFLCAHPSFWFVHIRHRGDDDPHVQTILSPEDKIWFIQRFKPHAFPPFRVLCCLRKNSSSRANVSTDLPFPLSIRST